MKNVLLPILLLCLFFLTVLNFIVLSEKHKHEKRNSYFATGVTFSEVFKLSTQEGKTPDAILDALKTAGIQYVFLEESTLKSLADNRYLDIIKCSDLVYKLYFYDNDIQNHMMNFLKSNGISFELKQKYAIFVSILESIEDNILNFPHGFSKTDEKIVKMAKLNLGYIVKGHNMLSLDDYNSKLSYFGMNDALYDPIPLILTGDNESFQGIKANHISSMINRSDKLYICQVEFSKPGLVSQAIKNVQSAKILMTHTLKEEENAKYSIERLLPRWVRAVRERSNKMLLVRLFFSGPKHAESLLKYNCNYIKNILHELEQAGYKQRKVSPLSIKPETRPQKFLLFIIYCTLIMVLARLLSDSKVFILTLLLGIASISGIYFHDYSMFLVCSSFFIANAGPLAGLAALISKTSLNAFLRVVISFLTVLISGLSVHSILFNLDYVQKVSIFKGVKIAFILPLLLYFIYLLIGESDLKDTFRKILCKEIKVFHLVLFILSGGILLLYLTRSGNFPLIPVHDLEILLRDGMEGILVARPRFKEFMIGYPCLFLWAISGAFKKPEIRKFIQKYSVFGILVGYVSIINTFEHIHTPVFISLLRCFNSFIFGTIIFLFIAGFTFIFKYVYGLSHFADEE